MNVETLIKQLGTALPMMGAKDLVADKANSILQFRVGKNPKGVSKVVITLNSDDTYTVSVLKGRGVNMQAAGHLAGVYADQLHGALTSLTGLYTRL